MLACNMPSRSSLRKCLPPGEVCEPESCRCPYKKEGKSENEQDNPISFPARFPWFSIEDGDHPENFKDTSFSKEVLGFGSDEKAEITLLGYQIIARSLPNLLHIEYHHSDFSASSSRYAKHSLRSASLYVLSTELHWPMFWAAFGKHHSYLQGCAAGSVSGPPPVLKALKCLGQYLKETSREANLCLSEGEMSPKEFLLDPWIHMRLPFQLSLLQQWALAALAEYWRVTEKVAEFLIFDVERLVKPLIEMVLQKRSDLINAITICFEIIKCWYEIFAYADSTADMIKFTLGRLYDPQAGIIPAFPALQLILSPGCANIINTLKVCNFNNPDCEMRTVSIDSEFLNLPPPSQLAFYGLHFWRTIGFNSSLDKLAQNDTYFQFSYSLNLDVDREEIKKFIEEEIINTGRIAGPSSEEILHSFSDQNLKSFVGLWKKFCWYQGVCKGISAEDENALLQVLILQSQAEAAIVLMKMCKKICDANPSSKFHAINCDGVFTTYVGIAQAFAQIRGKTMPSQISLIKTAQEKLTPPPKTMELPNVEILGLEEVAKLYETTLEYRLLEIYKNYYAASIDGEIFMTVYFEQPIMQYILPQIIGLLRTMDDKQTDGNVEINKYVYFLHRLIDAYTPENCFSIKTVDQQVKSFGGILMQGSKYFLQQKICFVQDVCTNLFPSINAQMLDGLIPLFTICNKYKCLERLNDVQLILWDLQIYQFMGKYLSSLEATCEYFGLNEFGVRQKFSYTAISILEITYVNSAVQHVKLDSFVDQAMKIFSCSNSAEDGKLFKKSKGKNDLSASKEQTFGIILFLAFKNVIDEGRPYTNLLLNILPVTDIISAYQKRDFWKAKKQLSFLMNDSNRVDRSLADFDTVKANMPLYDSIVKYVVRKQRVAMNKPGDITFVPIKHCRWCGKVSCAEFLICKECQLQEDYPDVNYFCSTKCEGKAMTEIHREEHCRFLIDNLKF